jgi:hypothetical protein
MQLLAVPPFFPVAECPDTLGLPSRTQDCSPAVVCQQGTCFNHHGRLGQLLLHT